MERKLIDDFMLKATLGSSKATNHDIPLIWNAIWRAHRDVLTGRFFLPVYCSKSRDVTEKLYTVISNASVIKSQYLLNVLTQEFEDVEFSAIQKLVNMTLKYLIIANEYDDDFNINIDEKECHCPVDSIILQKIKEHHKNKPNHTPWTRMQEDEYQIVQNEIREILDHKGYCKEGNIFFDFLFW